MQYCICTDYKSQKTFKLYQWLDGFKNYVTLYMDDP